MPRQHLILTRFNVRWAPASELSESWLQHRLDLFRRHCQPSVAGQTATDFRWLVFIDHASPPWLRTAIEACEPAEVVECDQVFSPDVASSLVAPHARRGHDLITTRLDNDDAIAFDFLERLGDAATPTAELAFINFNNGLQLSEGRLYWRPDPSNAFISALEPASTHPRTVFAGDHDQLATLGRVTGIGGPPMWLQVLHERNAANRVGGIRVDPRRAAGRFHLADVVDEPRWRLELDRVATAARMARRVAFNTRRWRWLARSVGPLGTSRRS